MSGAEGQNVMAINVQVGYTGLAGEQGFELSRTVALIDLRPITGYPDDTGSDGSAMLFDLALRKIEQVVRGDDRVCPFGISRVAIAFGPDADAVTPKTLGERLARAVRHSPLLAGQSD